MTVSNTRDLIKDNGDNFSYSHGENALIIFARNPELGKCKTRLAQTIGDEAALEIYKHLLRHTATITKNTNGDKFVFLTETIENNAIWDERIYKKKLQSEGNLGMKMEHAFLELFHMGYKRVILIGSDLFDITPQHINTAFLELTNHEVVIGPAEDGGYYLLGLSTMNASLFRNKSWSTHYLLEETIAELKENNIKFTTLETLNDIDTYEDLVASKWNNYAQNND